MKDNHIPRAVRLQNRINTLRGKIREDVPIGGGNPYYMCAGCGKSAPALSYDGHFQHCPYPGIEKQIAHYQKLLDEELGKV
jgi:hypothetical protein